MTLSACGQLSSSPVPTPAPSAPAWSQGTFTQPWQVDGYTTLAQWEREFGYMRDVGMDLFIYQWTADSKAKTTIYPTTIPGYSHAARTDQVEVALATAQRHGFRVFLGLAFNDEWWEKQGSDRDWLMREAGEMNAVADELYANYYSRYPETFAGWYINWEMDNWAGYNTDAAQKQNMMDALNAVSRHLDGLNPDLPSSIAPYFNTSGGATPAEWQVFWRDVMGQTSVDILMLQDGVGVGHATVADLPAWFGKVCAGVHAAGKQCWDDLENFYGTDNLTPAPTERVIAQHQAAAPYVDKIVTFSFIAAMSPEYGWDPTYYNAYKAYVDGQRQER